MYGSNVSSGRYEIQNWNKFLGKRNPTYRSSWELYVFRWCEKNPNILKWNSEVAIPYYNEIKGRKARYFVDLYLMVKTHTGEIKEYLVEIKPDQFTKPPKKGRKRKDVYIREAATYIQNQNKWEAAKAYAEKRGWEFKILTENQIFKG